MAEAQRSLRSGADRGPCQQPRSGPRLVPLASAWEWGALIAVGLDGTPLAPARPPRAVTESPRPRVSDRAMVAVVGALAIAAAALAALLV
jgi:hypothetical protein